MLNIRLATENRKAAAERLAEITGAESHYTRVPRCAYEVGLYTIEKDGSITVAEGTDLKRRPKNSRPTRTRMKPRRNRWSSRLACR